MGENATYYQDIDFQVEKRLAKDTKLNLMYMYQRYNQTLLEDMEECLIRISLWQMSNKSLRLTQHCVWKGSILHRKMAIKIGCLDWLSCRVAAALDVHIERPL